MLTGSHAAILTLPISQHTNNNTFVITVTALKGNATLSAFPRQTRTTDDSVLRCCETAVMHHIERKKCQLNKKEMNRFSHLNILMSVCPVKANIL